MDWKKRLANLMSVKSIVTLLLTAGLLILMFGSYNPPSEFVTLYCTSYGSVMTYFFTKQEDK